MKKLLFLFVAVIATSCSSDDTSPLNVVEQTAQLSVLDGDLLSYKDDAAFISEYSRQTELSTTEELQNWVSKKGHHALLNVVDSAEDIQDSILDNRRIIYSNAIKSIVNSDFKFKIGGKVIWLDNQNLYVINKENQNRNTIELKALKSEFNLYGTIRNSIVSSKIEKNSNSRFIIPNENRSKEWSFYYNAAGRDRRIFLTLFNETIVINNVTTSSKMFIRCVRQGKYCSFWSCRWNVENEPITLDLNMFSCGWNQNPNLFFGGTRTLISSSNNTILIADAGYIGVPLLEPGNFIVSGTAFVRALNGSATIPVTWSQPISWY